jgi:hypothetical protein
MANLNKPFGLAPHRNLAGGKWNEQTTRYYIPSADTLAYYVGDLVLSAAAGDTKGTPGVIKATAGTETYRGVIIGVEPANPQAVSLAGTALSLEVTNIPASKLKDYYVYVVDDPMCLFLCQGDGTATNQVATKANNNCSFTITAGSPAAPSAANSATVIASASINTTSTLSGKLVGLAPIPNNSYGSYSVYRVKLNTHEFNGSTAGV